MSELPIVSVVIPTKNRPELVCRAALSVFSQTVEELEVIVVIDGPDKRTMDALSKLHDRRLRCFELSESMGAADARNYGIRRAHTDWIALLDDDDEWVPEKLERQLSVVEGSSHPLPVIVTGAIIRSSQGDFVWPLRFPDPFEPVSEYLFTRRSFFVESFMQASTILAPRILFEEIPFRRGAGQHDDWDWLLRACAKNGVGLEYLKEPLVIWNDDMGRTRFSKTGNWRSSLDWIQSMSSLVTRKAYTGFVVTIVSKYASEENAWHAFWPLLRQVTGCGGARPKDYMLFLAMWITPSYMRTRLRTFFMSFMELF